MSGIRPRLAARPRRAPGPARSGASCGSQTTRGSARNHDSCRRAYRRVGRRGVDAGPPRRSSSRRPGRGPGGSRAPSTRCVRHEALAATRPLTSSTQALPATSGGPARRSARRGPDGRRRARAARSAAGAPGSASSRENGRPVSSTTSSARTMRRPLFGLDRVGRRRVDGDAAGARSVLDAALGELRLEPRSDRRVGGRDLEPVEGRSHVEAGAADEDGDAARARRWRRCRRGRLRW